MIKSNKYRIKLIAIIVTSFVISCSPVNRKADCVPPLLKAKFEKNFLPKMKRVAENTYFSVYILSKSNSTLLYYEPRTYIPHEANGYRLLWQFYQIYLKDSSGGRYGFNIPYFDGLIVNIENQDFFRSFALRPIVVAVEESSGDTLPSQLIFDEINLPMIAPQNEEIKYNMVKTDGIIDIGEVNINMKRYYRLKLTSNCLDGDREYSKVYKNDSTLMYLLSIIPQGSYPVNLLYSEFEKGESTLLNYLSISHGDIAEFAFTVPDEERYPFVFRSHCKPDELSFFIDSIGKTSRFTKILNL